VEADIGRGGTTKRPSYCFPTPCNKVFRTQPWRQGTSLCFFCFCWSGGKAYVAPRQVSCLCRLSHVVQLDTGLEQGFMWGGSWLGLQTLKLLATCHTDLLAAVRQLAMPNVVEPSPSVPRHERLQTSNLYHAFTNYGMYLYKIITRSPPYNSACFPSHCMPLLKANKSTNRQLAATTRVIPPSIVSKKKRRYLYSRSLSIRFISQGIPYAGGQE
jgi:hypothetical protein